MINRSLKVIKLVVIYLATFRFVLSFNIDIQSYFSLPVSVKALIQIEKAIKSKVSSLDQRQI